MKGKNLSWLFFKRFRFETRKYTAGIILTAGVTALFISMLIIGSSFQSALFRATGQKGPNINNILYDNSIVDLNETRPNYLNVTCQISDFYSIERVRLYYTMDFWESSEVLDGTYLLTNLSGNIYTFSIKLRNTTTTYLFFIWANNSAGYFNYNDNNGGFYHKRLQFDDGVDPTPPADPTSAFQKIMVGYYNWTVTRDPRPNVVVWANQSSNATVYVNGDNLGLQAYKDFFIFEPSSDLQIGINNINITLFQENDGVKNNYSRVINITIINTPINITFMTPENNSVVYNYLDKITFLVDEHVRADIRLTGPVNQSWNVTSYLVNYTLPFLFNDTHGIYNLSIFVENRNGRNNTFLCTFNFTLSPHPYISIQNLVDMDKVVNNSLTIHANFSEICNVTFENLNVTNSSINFTNQVEYNFTGIPTVAGMNFINISVENADGNRNYTVLKVQKERYIIHSYYYPPIVKPENYLTVLVNFSTNETASGIMKYNFDYNSTIYTESFSLLNGTFQEGFLQAKVLVPQSINDIEFNFTLNFGPEEINYNNSGNYYHVVVGYYYYDNVGPQNRDLSFSSIPKSIHYNTVRINLFDVSGVRNATIIYTNDPTFFENKSLEMEYVGTDIEYNNGVWEAKIPPYSNSTTVYFQILTYDKLNNSASYGIYSYTVDDSFINNPEQYIPGVLEINYEKAISGAITTLLAIMVLIIIVFLAIYISMNDQNVKREIYREEDRIFILKNICKLSDKSIRKYYYIEQIFQDGMGFIIGSVLGFLVLAPIFVDIVKFTLIEWTFDFQDLFYYSFVTLESWVGLLLVLFVLSSLLLKILQVDRYIEKLGYKS
ncbi:MAG: hypothetical protein ACTSUE_22420 [Promethearchaeota archaeon]